MSAWLYTLVSVFVVSIVSLVGAFTFALNEERLKKILLFLVSFSAGSLFGGAFIHLIPEAIEEIGAGVAFSVSIVSGILLFFVLEKIIHWRHCHIPTSTKHPHPYGTMNLIGDAFHNFIDGAVIAASFLISTPVGFATTVAVIMHEIPQEIGDFGVLIHAGYSKGKALFFNFLSALTALLGAVLILVIGAQLHKFIAFILPFTAGGFIYIAGSDLIPELHKESDLGKSIYQLFALILGVGLMLSLVLIG